MSGIGSDESTWEAVRQALEAHAKEVYGEDYVLQDFVCLGYVVSMGEDSQEESEYVLVTSTKADHIIDGLVAQVHIFNSNEG